MGRTWNNNLTTFLYTLPSLPFTVYIEQEFILVLRINIKGKSFGNSQVHSKLPAK